MKANVTVTVKHDGTAKVLIATVGDIADKEFNNRVTPPEEPKFQPEKYVLSKGNGKFDITGTKLLDDDAELADKYAETNANPYALMKAEVTTKQKTSILKPLNVAKLLTTKYGLIQINLMQTTRITSKLLVSLMIMMKLNWKLSLRY